VGEVAECPACNVEFPEELEPFFEVSARVAGDAEQGMSGCGRVGVVAVESVPVDMVDVAWPRESWVR